MDAVNAVPLLKRRMLVIAFLVAAAGVAGMGISYIYLASSHPLDVTAGGAGFVAGSILISAGVLSATWLSAQSITVPDQIRQRTHYAAFARAAFVNRWRAHFHENKLNRAEPKWEAPITLSNDTVAPLLRSLEQFQLGDGGGPASLIAWNVDTFSGNCDATRELVDCWFAEEQEHARLLKRVVDRFGGTCIDGHWSFSAFCTLRKWLGVRFELTILLLTEIVSTVYYRLIRRRACDEALRGVCGLILRDEAGHVAFHRERLAQASRSNGAHYGRVWECAFRMLGLAAATMLWANHAPGLKAIGVTRSEFYGNAWAELSRFIKRLRRDAAATIKN